MEIRKCDRKTCRLHGGADCEFLHGNSCLLSKQRLDALIYAFIYSYSGPGFEPGLWREEFAKAMDEAAILRKKEESK